MRVCVRAAHVRPQDNNHKQGQDGYEHTHEQGYHVHAHERKELCECVCARRMCGRKTTTTSKGKTATSIPMSKGTMFMPMSARSYASVCARGACAAARQQPQARARRLRAYP